MLGRKHSAGGSFSQEADPVLLREADPAFLREADPLFPPLAFAAGGSGGRHAPQLIRTSSHCHRHLPADIYIYSTAGRTGPSARCATRCSQRAGSESTYYICGCGHSYGGPGLIIDTRSRLYL